MPLFKEATSHIDLPHCPAELHPDVLVSRADPLLNANETEIRDYLRSRYSPSQLKDQLLAIHTLGQQRDLYGDRGSLGLGGARGHQGTGTAPSAVDWLHDHELKRANQIQLALPTFGEEALAARERIAARIDARKARRMLVA